MAKYEFSLVLEGDIELTDEIADELFSAGCSDGSPGTSEGVFVIDFHRQAASLEAAIRTAVADVERAGYRVARVEMDAHAVPQSA
jgi:hypothetical protein